jgi:hypothetical protein
MNFPHKQRAMAAATMLGLSFHAWAAGEEPIVPDRPGVAESSQVVGKGRFQVETSFARERDANGPEVVHTTTTPTLLRYGVSDSLELRVETDGRVHTWPASTGSERGYANTELGIKWHVMDGRGSTPSVGVLVHAELPTGSAQFRGEGVRPSVRVVGEWDLPADLSLGVMPGIASDTNDNGQRFTKGILAVSLGKAWTPHFHGFLELAAPRIAHARDGGSQFGVDAGLAYLPSDNCQVDFSVGHGLNRRTPDLSWNVGVSFRL